MMERIESINSPSNTSRLHKPGQSEDLLLASTNCFSSGVRVKNCSFCFCNHLLGFLVEQRISIRNDIFQIENYSYRHEDVLSVSEIVNKYSVE